MTENKKICPLLTAGSFAGGRTCHEVCREEYCMLWTGKRCSLSALNYLDGIKGNLDLIAEDI